MPVVSELNPCPFCGASAEEYTRYIMQDPFFGSDVTFVRCKNSSCGANMRGNAEKWNARAVVCAQGFDCPEGPHGVCCCDPKQPDSMTTESQMVAAFNKVIGEITPGACCCIGPQDGETQCPCAIRAKLVPILEQKRDFLARRIARRAELAALEQKL